MRGQGEGGDGERDKARVKRWLDDGDWTGVGECINVRVVMGNGLGWKERNRNERCSGGGG